MMALISGRPILVGGPSRELGLWGGLPVARAGDIDSKPQSRLSCLSWVNGSACETR